MTIFKSFIPIAAALLLSASAQGQTTIVQGYAPEWSGREVRLVRQMDPFSHAEIQLASAIIDAEGTFTLQTKFENTLCLQLYVNRFNSPICLDPGERVAVSIFPNEYNKLIDTWQKLNFELVYTDVDTGSTAALMSAIDQAYYDFFAENGQLIGSKAMRSKIATFEIENRGRYNWGNAFIADYFKYTIAEIELSNGISKNQLYEAYLKDAEPKLDNPAWVTFFDLFYTSYFNAYDSRFGGRAIYNHLSEGITFGFLDSLLLKDAHLSNDYIRQLVVLKSISEVYTDKRYPQKALITIANKLSEIPANPLIGQISKRLVEKMEKAQQPVMLSDLGLNLGQIEAHSSTNPSDPRLVYLAITAPWSTQSINEMNVLSDLLEKYPDEFRVIEVSLAAEGIASPPPSWPRVYVADVQLLMEALSLYTIPGFVWFDAQWKLTDANATKPSEGLENELYKLKSKRLESQTIKVGQ